MLEGEEVRVGAPHAAGTPARRRVARDAHPAPVSIGQVARAEGLSPEYTAKLLRQLRLGRLVSSVRGASGGYRLARPAREISVWQALRALGGEPFPSDFCDCHPGARSRCVRRSNCAVRALWGRLRDVLRETLEAISLEDLCRDEAAMQDWLVQLNRDLATGRGTSRSTNQSRRMT